MRRHVGRWHAGDAAGWGKARVRFVPVSALQTVIGRRTFAPATHITRLFGFAGTLLLPIDIAQAYEETSPAVFETLWVVVYWVTFFLTWVILPLQQVCLPNTRSEVARAAKNTGSTHHSLSFSFCLAHSTTGLAPWH